MDRWNFLKKKKKKSFFFFRSIESTVVFESLNSKFRKLRNVIPSSLIAYNARKMRDKITSEKKKEILFNFLLWKQFQKEEKIEDAL